MEVFNKTMKLLYDSLDEDMSKIENVICQKSCNHCCNQEVFINPLEGVYIANYIKTLSFDEQNIIKEKIKNWYEELFIFTSSGKFITGLDFSNFDEERHLQYKNICLFSDEQKGCKIYSVRPISCRTHISKDNSTCFQSRLNNTDIDADKIKKKYLNIYSKIFNGIYYIPLFYSLAVELNIINDIKVFSGLKNTIEDK